MTKTIALLGALDTKGAEYGFVKECIERRGLRTLVIDVGVLDPPRTPPDISRRDVACAGGADLDELVRQLEGCRAPRTCPHGRPTTLKLSLKDLEKQFKRTGF